MDIHDAVSEPWVAPSSPENKSLENQSCARMEEAVQETVGADAPVLSRTLDEPFVVEDPCVMGITDANPNPTEDIAQVEDFIEDIRDEEEEFDLKVPLESVAGANEPENVAARIGHGLLSPIPMHREAEEGAASPSSSPKSPPLVGEKHTDGIETTIHATVPLANSPTPHSHVENLMEADDLPETIQSLSEEFSKASIETPNHKESLIEAAVLDHSLNDSIVSSGSAREEEILQTTRDINTSSQAFIYRLRGAAFRRKMNLTRSRDSLVAKEKQHREDLARAVESAANLAVQRSRRQSEPLPQIRTEESVKVTFKARSVPAAVGIKGTGGLSGVPKVEKKPTTIPFSPLLGARRQLRRLTSPWTDSQANTNHISGANDGSKMFMARPLPKTTGFMGQAGQSGIPKVPKRPVTVPCSPLLGARRQSSARVQKHIQTLDPVPDDISTATLPSVTSGCNSSTGVSSLHGLTLLIDENQLPQPNVPLEAGTLGSGTVASCYIPHSTVRAQKRAAYDAQRQQVALMRLEQEQQARRAQVQALDRELKALRTSL